MINGCTIIIFTHVSFTLIWQGKPELFSRTCDQTHSWQTRLCSRVRANKFISAFFITPNQARYLVDLYANTARKVQVKVCLPLKCVRRNKQYLSQRSISCACCLPACTSEMLVGARLCQEPAAPLASELGQRSTQSDALRQCGKVQTVTEGNTHADVHVWRRMLQEDTDSRTSGESQQTSAAAAPPFCCSLMRRQDDY